MNVLGTGMGMKFWTTLQGSCFVAKLSELFSEDDEKSRWRRSQTLFLEKKGGWRRWKMGRKKKERKWNNNSKPGYYFNCRNRLIVAELATSPFPVFLLSSGNREERFMSWNRCWWGSAPGLSGAPGSLPQTQPGEGEPTMPLPSSLWIIDLIYINYRRFSGSVGRARGRCVGWGVVGVEFQERRIWEGKWFNQHQFS